MAAEHRAWLQLLANIEKAHTRWGAFSTGGCLHPQDRALPLRLGDKGAAWAGLGLEARAHFTSYGGMLFDEVETTGAFHSMLQREGYYY